MMMSNKMHSPQASKIFSVIFLALVTAGANGRLLAPSSSASPRVLPSTPVAINALRNGILLLSPPVSIPREEIVRFDVHVDLLCKGSRSFQQKTLTGLLDRYQGTQLEVVLHFFPLPYFRYSYMVDQIGLGFAMSAQDPQDAVEKWSNAVFPILESLRNVPTANMTAEDVTTRLMEVASSAGLSGDEARLYAWDDEVDSELQVAMRSAWSNGVTGTPYLFLNGAPLALSSWDKNSTLLPELSMLMDPILASPPNPEDTSSGRVDNYWPPANTAQEP